MTKLKEVQLNNVVGTVRVEYFGGAGTTVNEATLQLYKNDIPYGPARVFGAGGSGTFTEDIPFAAGDRIAIYGASTNPSYIAYVNYIKLSVAKLPATTTVIL